MKIVIDVRWDAEAEVWYAVSRGGTGLMTEAPTLDALRERIIAVAPDLFDLPVSDIEIEMIVHGLLKHSSQIAAE
jgi:hypothetical protein